MRDRTEEMTPAHAGCGHEMELKQLRIGMHNSIDLYRDKHECGKQKWDKQAHDALAGVVARRMRAERKPCAGSGNQEEQ